MNVKTLYLAIGVVLLIGALAFGSYLYSDTMGISEEGSVERWFYKEALLRTIGYMLFGMMVGIIGGVLIGYSSGGPSEDHS
jgi:hypothetical protein